MKNILYKNKGFTLVEMAIVLVIVGLLVGMGAGMIGPLTAMSKVRGSREVVEADIATVVSWAASNNRLPDASSGTSDFKSVVKTPIDSWGRDIIYLYDSVLAPSTATKDTICGRKTTSIAISNSAITPTHTINNAAFIVLSKGDDAQLQTTASDGAITISRSVTGTVTLDPNVSDIVRWVTLDELRSKIGCQGSQLKIVNNELPYGNKSTTINYTATIYADGGAPFSTGGSYKWCIKGTLPTGITNPTPACTATTNCSSLGAEDATQWYQSDSLQLNAPPTLEGSYSFKVLVRDNNDNSATSSIDNCIEKSFVISINP